MMRIGAALILMAAVGLSVPEMLRPDERALADVRLSQPSFTPGDSGLLLVSFRLPPDHHVNSDPAVDLAVPGQTLIMLCGTPIVSSQENSNVLNTDTPVCQKFFVPRNAATTSASLDVMVTYFYCSDVAGWCRMRTDTCRVSLNILSP
jgi:hypothetical protein